MALIDKSILDDLVTTGTAAAEFESLTGREMYEIESISTLNKLPVTLLASYVLAGFNAEAPETLPTDPITLAQDFLIQGSIVFIRKQFADIENSQLIDIGNDYFRLEEVEIINERHFVEFISKDITRVYTLGVSTWSVVDIKNMDTKNEVVLLRGTLDADAIIVLVNGVGILEPYNKTYQRLEEIEDTLRGQTTKAALTTIVGGAAGNKADVKKAIRDGHTLMMFPTSNISVHRVGDSQITDQLLRQQDSLMKRYFRAMSIVELEEAKQLSGVARRITMIPTINVVQFNRQLMLRVLKEMGYTNTITFSPISIMDTKEKIEEINFLTMIKPLINMDEKEYQRRLKDLLV